MANNSNDNQDVINALSFFDCNCMIGKRSDRKEGEPWSLDSLCQDMEYFGITDTLVSNALSKDFDPITGNRELIQIISGQHNLHPVWTIVPSPSAEIQSPKQFLEESEINGVEAFTAFPKLHNFSMMGWTIGPLLGEIEKLRAPLLLPFSETSWDEVHSICTSYPRLPVIVHTVNYRQLRYLLPLWDKHLNLYVDISWFSIVDIIPFLEKNNFLDRLLFGTNYPIYTPGAAVTMVTYSGTNDDVKKKIAGNNLRKLLQDKNRLLQ